MNPSSQLASATGSMGMVSALSIALQWGLGLIPVAVTNDQAAALSILLFPFAHLLFMKVGANLDEKQPKDRRPGDKLNGEAKEPGK